MALSFFFILRAFIFSLLGVYKSPLKSLSSIYSFISDIIKESTSSSISSQTIQITNIQPTTQNKHFVAPCIYVSNLNQLTVFFSLTVFKLCSCPFCSFKLILLWNTCWSLDVEPSLLLICAGLKYNEPCALRLEKQKIGKHTDPHLVPRVLWFYLVI